MSASLSENQRRNREETKKLLCLFFEESEKLLYIYPLPGNFPQKWVYYCNKYTEKMSKNKGC